MSALACSGHHRICSEDQFALRAVREACLTRVRPALTAARALQAEWEAMLMKKERENMTLKQRQREVEASSASLLQNARGEARDASSRERRVLAYAELVEVAAGRQWQRHLCRCVFVAMSSHARQRTRMWNMALAYIKNRNCRDAQRSLALWLGFCKRGAFMPAGNSGARKVHYMGLWVQPCRLSLQGCWQRIHRLVLMYMPCFSAITVVRTVMSDTGGRRNGIKSVG